MTEADRFHIVARPALRPFFFELQSMLDSGERMRRGMGTSNIRVTNAPRRSGFFKARAKHRASMWWTAIGSYPSRRT